MIPRYGHATHPPGVVPDRLGPERDAIPTAAMLGTFSEGICRAAICDMHLAGDRNDLGDAEKYPVSKGVSLDGYRQVLLQHKATTGLFEKDYTVDGETAAVRLLRAAYPTLNFYRARLLILDPGHEVPWHTDTSPRDFCRIHFMIWGEAVWQFRRRGENYGCRMQRQEIWWTSVGWPHTIRAGETSTRIVLTVHADWHDMVATFGEPVEGTVLA